MGLHEALGFEPLEAYSNVSFQHGAWRDVGWWQKALRDLDAQLEQLKAFDGQVVAIPA
jgi:L-amino acid N-acyltransferase YncA